MKNMLYLKPNVCTCNKGIVTQTSWCTKNIVAEYDQETPQSQTADKP